MNRKPILLSKNACALILIFDRTDEIFDVMAGAYENLDPAECYEMAALEFVDQLEGHDATHFLEALRDRLNEILDEEKNDV